jgi:hypothetical protein
MSVGKSLCGTRDLDVWSWLYFASLATCIEHYLRRDAVCKTLSISFPSSGNPLNSTRNTLQTLITPLKTKREANITANNPNQLFFRVIPPFITRSPPLTFH